jgi:hypothetical protein
MLLEDAMEILSILMPQVFVDHFFSFGVMNNVP